MSKKPLGILIIHGYSGAPQGLSRVAQPFHDLGLPYSLPTLKGHCESSPDVLNGIHWSEWIKDGENALDELLAQAEKVVIIGHSMGGWIALHLAIDHKERIDSIIVAAGSTRSVSPFGPGGRLNFLAPLFPIFSKRWDMPPVFADPAYTTVHHGYNWIPTKTWLNIFDFMRKTEERLPEVTVPAMILHSKNDSSNAPYGAEILYANLSTPEDQKSLVWFEETEHDMFNDCERDAVIDTVVEYVKTRL